MFYIQQLFFIFASFLIQIVSLQASQNPEKSPTAVIPQPRKLITKGTLANLRQNSGLTKTLGGSSLHLLNTHAALTDEQKKAWEAQQAKDYVACKQAWQVDLPQKNQGCFCFGSSTKKKKPTKQLR